MPPGGLCSKEEETPTNYIRTNISSNENEADYIHLTYNVSGARASDCHFNWEPNGEGYVGTMEARDRGTMYQHTFPKTDPPVPTEIVKELKQPINKSKNGDRIVFTFRRRDRNTSLQPYIRR